MLPAGKLSVPWDELKSLPSEAVPAIALHPTDTSFEEGLFSVAAKEYVPFVSVVLSSFMLI